MAIKVPNEMVYYSERDAQSERFLCWIPHQQYRDVAVDEQALQRLRQDYPMGVEVRVDPEELKAVGIKLPVAPVDLIKTYKGLQNKDVLHESGMIIARTLERIAKEAVRGETLDYLIDADSRQPLSFHTPARRKPQKPVNRIVELPEMKGDEEPQSVFQRLSVRQLSK